MYQNAIGFSPKSLLSGLHSRGAFAKGQAMQAASGLDMDRAQKNQEFAVKQMQDEGQQRQASARNSAQQATNASQERTRSGDMSNRAKVFDMNMGFDYASLAKKRELGLAQSILNGLARDF